MARKEIFDFVVCKHSNSHLKETSFLLQKPFAQLFIPTVSKSAYKVRNFIILAEFLVVFLRQRSEFILCNTWLLFFKCAFECKFTLPRILINLKSQVAFTFIRVVPNHPKLFQFAINFWRATYINSIFRNTCNLFIDIDWNSCKLIVVLGGSSYMLIFSRG